MEGQNSDECQIYKDCRAGAAGAAAEVIVKKEEIDFLKRNAGNASRIYQK